MSLYGLFSESDDTYHAKSGVRFLSSHLLSDIRTKGFDILHEEKQEEEANPNFRFGTLVHLLILEGYEVFADRVVCGGPVNPKTGRAYGGGTKAFAKWCDELPEGKIGCTSEEYELAFAMRHAVRRVPEARDLLRDGRAEVVARCRVGGLNCQGRIDWLCLGNCIVDLKTCRSLSEFHNDAVRFGYYYQAAFYGMLYSRLFGDWPKIVFMPVSKDEIPGATLWQPARSELLKALDTNLELMQRLETYLQECPTCKAQQMLANVSPDQK